jgi:hypothetical protein
VMALISRSAIAQDGIACFYDQNNRLNVFEKGSISEIENHRVRGLQAGVNYLAYINESNSLVLYHDHQKRTIEEFAPVSMIATSYSLVYKTGQRLMICEEGQKKLLSGSADSYFADDSIVVWQSLVTYNIMAYYKGKIKVIKFFNSDLINDGKVGSNIFAFSERNFDFKIFYNDSIYDTGSSRIARYECGKDVVAYLDEYSNTFNAFYKGKQTVLSNTGIKNFKVGNQTIAFIDDNNTFNIFYKGKLNKIDSYPPDYYYVNDNVICYSYNSNIKLVYGGKIYNEESINKFNIDMGANSILYSTYLTNIPTFFYKGNKIRSFYIPQPYTMLLHWDLPVFHYLNTIAFLYEGKLYEYGIGKNEIEHSNQIGY